VSARSQCTDKGRALSAEAKRAVVERILRAWLTQPHHRLGQLIENAMHDRGAAGALFYVEDETLATVAELYASEGAARGAVPR
jgi:hypothetical protein